MTTSTTSIRWVATKQVIDLVRAQPGADRVLVESGWPGDKNVTSEMIWVDTITDSVNEIPVMTGSRMHRDDHFTIVLLTRVASQRTLDETMTRLEELGALIEDPPADSPTLDDLDSVVSADFVTTDLTCGQTPQGPVGYGRHELRLHTRLT